MKSSNLRCATRRAVASWRGRWAAVGWAGWMAVLGALPGCAGVAGSGVLPSDAPAETKQSVVASRAAARWDALIRGDLDAAYNYMTEASREAVPLDRFKARRQAVVVREAKVLGVACGVDTCTAEILLTYDHRSFKGGSTRTNETWIWERGQMAFVDPLR